MRPPTVRFLRRASHTLLWSTLEKPPSLVDRGSLRFAGCPSRLVRYRTGSPQTQRCWQRLHRLQVDQVTDVRRPACGGCRWRGRAVRTCGGEYSRPPSAIRAVRTSRTAPTLGGVASERPPRPTQRNPFPQDRGGAKGVPIAPTVATVATVARVA